MLPLYIFMSPIDTLNISPLQSIMHEKCVHKMCYLLRNISNIKNINVQNKLLHIIWLHVVHVINKHKFAK